MSIDTNALLPVNKDNEEEGEDGECTCNPYECEPVDEENLENEKRPTEIIIDHDVDGYQLDEFMRAKAYFLQTSTHSGLNLYDHLSEVIRKFLDERAPNNPVDYLEEISMNIKRYRFGINKKTDPMQDTFHISEPVLSDAKRIAAYWKIFAKWSEEKKEIDGEGMFMGGSFQNLLRLQYYLEQINIGLPRDEMFRIALGMKDLSASRAQIGKLRFWGKIFGIQKNYYIIEAELKFGGSEQAIDLWTPSDDDPTQPILESLQNIDMENVLDAVQTFSRAKDVVLNHEFLTAYSKTSGLPPEKQADLLPKPASFFIRGTGAEWTGEGEEEDIVEFEDPAARAEAMKWEGYQEELMETFPQVGINDPVFVPMEPDGQGVNRRAFYVCNDISDDWLLLPPITPQQVNAARTTRWFLTGNLNSPLKTVPPFPGKEGHYLKALLVRITAGAMVSPKGFYKMSSSDREMPGEEDDEEMEPEDDEQPPSDDRKVQPVKKYTASMKALTKPDLSFWVHHTSCILPQGRTIWWNPAAPKIKTKRSSFDDESEMDGEDDEDEDEEGSVLSGREIGPPLFSPISEDRAPDGRSPWTLLTSSSVFPEFQVAAIRSNVWTGSNAICTVKGKVNNIYLGDGLKFSSNTFSPPVPGPATKEFRAGPELQETPDPSAEQEQSWLEKLALHADADAENKFGDNEEETAEEEEEEDEF